MSNEREYMRRYMSQRYHQRHTEVISKLGGSCVECGSEEGLEVDHIDPSTKSFTIGSRLAGIAKHKLEAELKKCQLLCKLCHEEKSIADMGFERAKHGSLSMYTRHKCRCEPCRESARKYQVDYQRSRNSTGKRLAF